MNTLINKNKKAFTFYKTVLTFITGTLFFTHSVSQNLVFANYKQAGLLTNPAILSENPGMQATVNFRNIQLIPGLNYYTSMFSFQMPLNYQYRILNPANIAFAIYGDRMSHSGYLSTSGMALAYAQPVQLSSNSVLTLGMQLNYYERKFDISGYSTGSQWDQRLGLNTGLPIGEDLVSEKIDCYAINSGLLWQMKDKSGETKAYLGTSVYNLNKPDEGFSTAKQPVDWRYIVIGGYRIFDNGDFRITPEILYTRDGRQNYFNSGVKFGIATSGNNPYLPFNKGLFNISSKYLSNQSIMIGASLEQPRYDFGISYDYSFNLNSPSSNAVEFFVVVRFGRTHTRVEKPVAQDYQIGQVRDFFAERKQESSPDMTSLNSNKNKSADKEHKPVSIALKRDFKFGFNEATLNDESKAYLDELITLLERNERMSIEIVGHTDDVGTDEGNRIISLKRAQVVADYFLSKGITEDRIKVTGRMNKEPLFPNNSPENRARNRRVEFILTE